MNKELAKVFTTAIVQYIDSERPVGTMCCSNAECESIEEMFEGECFDIIEAFIQKKLSRLTEFEQEVSDIVEYCKEHGEHVAFDYAKRHAKTLLSIAREQFIKDGYVIEKKAFHDAVEKVDPKVMKEVSDNVDKENELGKKHLDGYIMGREYTLREMKDFIESHFNCDKAREGTYYKDYERNPEPIPTGIPYQSPQCGTNATIVPNINSGTLTLKADG